MGLEKPEPSLEDSLVDSIHAPDLTETLAEVAQVGFDQLLSEDNVLRDIPVFGTVVRLAKTVGVIRDRIFLAKVLRFLARLGDIPPQDRVKFVKSMEDRGERQRVGEALVLLLDRMDDMDKPELLAKLFAAYLREHIDLETFRWLASALDSLKPGGVRALNEFYDTGPGRMADPQIENLVGTGLVRLEFFSAKYDMNATGRFIGTDLGKQFLSIVNETQT